MTVGDVKAEILEYINSSKGVGYGSFDLNPNYKPEAIVVAIIGADNQVSMAIAATAGHSHRPKFQTTGSFVNTDPPSWFVLPESDSDPEGIMITPTNGSPFAGSFAPQGKIKLWAGKASNYGGPDVVDGYYTIASNMVMFTGKQIDFVHFRVPAIPVDPVPDDSTVLNSPDVYRATVVKLASAEMLSKLEDFMYAATFCEQLGRTDLQNIKSDKYFVPQSLMQQKQE